VASKYIGKAGPDSWHRRLIRWIVDRAVSTFVARREHPIMIRYQINTSNDGCCYYTINPCPWTLIGAVIRYFQVQRNSLRRSEELPWHLQVSPFPPPSQRLLKHKWFLNVVLLFNSETFYFLF